MALTLQDLIQGLDLTGRTSVTAAELLQLISSATPAADKGLNILTADVGGVAEVPDPSDGDDYLKFKRYIWLRQQATSLVAYVWNNNASLHATYLKWQEITVAAIADLSVTNSKLADGAVDTDKVDSIAFSKITGVDPFLLAGDAATGDMLGSTYADLTIAGDAVDSAKLKSSVTTDGNRAVTTDHIRDKAITLAKLVLSVTAKQIMRVKAIPADGWELVTNYFAQLDTLGTSYQIPQTNAGATAIEWVNKQILQTIHVQTQTAVSGATTIPADNSTPLFNEGNQWAAMDCAITPKLATSYLLVEVSAHIAATNGAAHNVVLALFRDPGAADAAKAISYASMLSDTDEAGVFHIVYKVASTAAALTTFKVNYGAESGTSYANRTPASATKYGNLMISSIKVTEYATL